MSTPLLDGSVRYAKHNTLDDLLMEGFPVMDKHDPDIIKAKEIMRKLLKHVTLPKPVYLSVLDTSDTNGNSAPDGDVAITRGALKSQDDNVIAFVLAHELGHLLKGAIDPSQWHVKDEDDQIEADRLSIGLIRKAGFGKNLDSIIRQLESYDDPDDFNRIETLRHFDS